MVLVKGGDIDDDISSQELTALDEESEEFGTFGTLPLI